MEYIVGRRVALPGSVSPYAVSLSQCGVVAAVTLQGVHLFVRYLVPLNSLFPEQQFKINFAILYLFY